MTSMISVKARLSSEDGSSDMPASPLPSAVSSSDLSLSDHESTSHTSGSKTRSLLPGKAGEISPSSTCRQRKMSAAVVTTPDAKHDYVEGRPKLIMPNLGILGRSATKGRKLGLPLKPKPTLHRSSTETIDRRFAALTMQPPPLRLEAWAEPPACNYNVRGPDYLRNKKKVPSESSAFKLLTVDMIKVDAPNFKGICAQPNERIQKALRREQETGEKELPEFIFAVNLCVPGSSYYHMVAYYGCDDINMITNKDTPFGRVAEPFFFGESDDYRNKTFKLIPHIVEGNYIVRKAVGSKPTLLGTRLKQHYIRTDRYFEIIIDIGSSPVAQRIVKLALGYAKTLVVDMMFVLEGKQEDMLPERIAGGMRIKNVDFKKKDGQRVLEKVCSA
jgi:hypothetical protein